MSKKCPNCGYQESDDSTFCHICGAQLVEEESPSQDFDFDFGGDAANQGSNVEGMSFNGGSFPNETSNNVPIKLDVNKANKYKRSILPWAAFILVASILGLILNLTSLEDTKDIQSSLPMILDEYYGVFSTAVNVYYAGVVLLAFLSAAAIAYLIFASKLKKFNFPVQNDEIFGIAKKSFFASIPVVVVECALFIVELVAVINLVQMQLMFDDVNFNIGTNLFYLIKDLIVLVGTIMSMVYCKKIADCKQN